MTQEDKIIEQFNDAFGLYWSKAGDTSYIGDPINNTRPVILDQELVQGWLRNTLTTYRAQVLEEVKQWAKSNARTKDTAMSDFEENHVWDVDYYELIEFLEHPTN